MNEHETIERHGSVWNVVALVATLGLATVVAVVAVTRSDRTPVAQPTPTASSPSPSPSASGAPGLTGRGPYVVYALAGEVFAYDLAARAAVSLGRIDGELSDELPRQPWRGAAVAFATGSGTAWRVTRTSGLETIARFDVAAEQLVTGAVVSPDGRRLAVGLETPSPALVVVDLSEGTTTRYDRRGTGQYPEEPLVPVGWSLGGSLVYQMPLCRCDGGDPGLYTFDLQAERSAIVSATRSLPFYRFAMSPDAQSLVYGTATARRCEGEGEGCTGPPYQLRRIAAGRSGTQTLRRVRDRSFGAFAWSTDGATVLVRRDPATSGAGRLELLDAETGESESDPRVARLAAGLDPLTVLDDGSVLAVVTSTEPGADPRNSSILLAAEAGPVLLAAATADERVYFLGWLK